MAAPEFWLSRDEVRELDRRAIDGFSVPGIVLMENAGRGCAELLRRLNPDRAPVLILCGPGNNGGDGFVIARHLDNHGWPVDVFVVAKSNQEPGDADINFDIVYASGVRYTQCHPDHLTDRQADTFRRTLRAAGWVVDALFGTGLSRPIGPPFDRLIEAVNESGKPVFAIDIPSGLDCDTGEPLGPTVKAAHTATFVAHKKGFLNPVALAWTGEIHVVEIGTPRVLVEEYRRRRGAGA
jgi:NAD(P)H-hydrate epimerase